MSLTKQHQFIINNMKTWNLIKSLLGGTPAMQRAGEKYLPRRKYEQKKRYDDRLELSTLLPAFEDAVKELVGRAFFKPMKVENMPGWIEEEVQNNVDREGRSLSSYCQDWAQDAIAYGLSHTLIDAPSGENVTTLAEQKEADMRPFLIMLPAMDVINWERKDGKLVKFSCYLLVDEKQVLRVYTRGNGNVSVVDHERQETSTNGQPEWKIVRSAVLQVSEIPLVTLYTDRTAPLQSDPPLRELAYMNRKHYVIQSGIDALVDIASVPILLLVGDAGGLMKDPEQKELEIGANTAMEVGHGGDAKYVEHSGKAIDSGQYHLAKLEDNMRRIGAKMLIKNVGMASKTKEEASEDQYRENSPMSLIMHHLTTAVVELINALREWRNTPTKPVKFEDVKFNPNLEPNDDTVGVMKVLKDLAVAGKLSNETLFEAAKLRGVVPENVTWEVEKLRQQRDMSVMVDPQSREDDVQP